MNWKTTKLTHSLISSVKFYKLLMKSCKPWNRVTRRGLENIRKKKKDKTIKNKPDLIDNQLNKTHQNILLHMRTTKILKDWQNTGRHIAKFTR